MKRYLSVAALFAGMLTATAAAQTPIKAELVASGFNRPVFVTHAPGDSNRLYVVEKNQGDIEILTNGVLSGTFIDLTSLGVSTGSEQGLLGLAFHPDYETNKWFFTYRTNSGGATVIDRFTATDNDSADVSTRVQVMTFGQPQSNHNGGMIAFSPIDGYLYIGTGDGGNGNDSGSGHAVGGNAQAMSTRLGKILRIDVDSLPFTTPANNPFASDPFPANEFWAIGVRNPWRFSFDRDTGDMWIGDVGQNAREEITYQPASSTGGENYGWRLREGYIQTPSVGGPKPAGNVDPVHQYNTGFPGAVIGGYVYRGESIPDLKGTYFFSDYHKDKIWTLDYDGTPFPVTSPGLAATDRTAELGFTNPIAISAFGEDADGELYIVDDSGGDIWKIVADGPYEGLGFATNGTYGEPTLHGEGTMVAGTSGALRVQNALEFQTGALFVSFNPGPLPAPAFGGFLMAGLPWAFDPPLFIPTNGLGEVNLPWASWPPGLPSGFEIYYHYALEDAGVVPFGIALTNGLKSTAP